MRKNSKGFTLVELLAIVVILALIAVIAAPNMTRQIRENEENTQNILNQKIENAAHLYAAKYYANKLVNISTSGEIIEFTLSDLQSDGLINLKGNCTNNLTASNEIDDNKIKITSSGYNYENIESDGDTCYEG